MKSRFPALPSRLSFEKKALLTQELSVRCGNSAFLVKQRAVPLIPGDDLVINGRSKSFSRLNITFHLHLLHKRFFSSVSDRRLVRVRIREWSIKSN